MRRLVTRSKDDPKVEVSLERVAEAGVVEGLSVLRFENGRRFNSVAVAVRGRAVADVLSDAKKAVAKNIRLPAETTIEWNMREGK